MIKSFFAMYFALFTFNAFACVGGKGYLPPNNMNIAVGAKNGGGITQVEFNEVIDKVYEVYTPIIRQRGASLKINRLWSDGTVNARAYRQGSTYMVDMYGGLARHRTMTKDGFALVACHEVGHHIGGAPLYTGSQLNWASTEGQSDYFAVTKCLRKLMANDDNVNIVRQMKVNSTVEKKCEDQFSVSNDAAICKRISMGGFASSNLFADMSGGRAPSFENPDKTVVRTTYESHPQYQCRLDTYFQGANCTVDEEVDVSNRDPNVGTCNRVDNFTEGLRPLCWFKPATSTNPTPRPTPNPNPGNPSGNIAKTPLINGQTIATSRNPNNLVPISLDIRGVNGAVYFAIEISKPNMRFSNPNGTSPDRSNGLGFEVHQGLNGVYRLLPSRQLPGYGTYQIRIIALDQNRRPVSKYSNSLTLVLTR